MPAEPIPRPNNFFSPLPDATTSEQFTQLLAGKNFQLERIVSHGQFTPKRQWYDQPRDEWVLLLRGAATLRFDNDEGSVIELGEGDCLHIPARRRHRVEWTLPDEPTVWLAIHFEAAS